MLDFLIVLGRVPGTDFVITFNQILVAFFVVSARYEYKLHEKWLKWLWRRTCVNYRKRKRRLKAFIKTKRYRLGVFERRIRRRMRSYLRRQRQALVMAVIRRRKRLLRNLRRGRRALTFAVQQFLRRTKRRIRLTMRRRQRGVCALLYRNYSLLRRHYYSQVIELQRAERRLKRRLAFVGWND